MYTDRETDYGDPHLIHGIPCNTTPPQQFDEMYPCRGCQAMYANMDDLRAHQLWCDKLNEPLSAITSENNSTGNSLGTGLEITCFEKKSLYIPENDLY